MTRIHPLLLASLRSFPHEEGPRERLAEWYERSGDQRGEALRALLEISKLPRRASRMTTLDRARLRALSSRFAELREDHEELWLDEWGLEPSEITWENGLPALTLTWDRLWKVGAHALESAPVIQLRVVGDDGDLAELAHWPHLQGVVCLDLSRDSVGAGRIASLLESPYLSELKELELGNNCIGDDGASVLARAEALCGLEKLGLASNTLTGLGLWHLLDSPVLASLTDLDLHNNHLDRNHASWLKPPDSAMARLRVLRLGRSRLGPRGLWALATSRPASSIEVLELSHNRLGDEGIIDLCAFTHLVHLQHLDLGRNSVSDRGAKALAACDHLGRLQSLELDENQVSAEGVTALLSQPSLSSLERLSLRGNPLGEAGALAIAGASQATNLRDLDLEGAAIGGSAVTALATSPGLHCLKALGLRDNPLGDTAAELANAQRLPDLSFLDVQESRIPARVAKALRARFKDDVLL